MTQNDGVQYSKDPLDSCCGYSSHAILQTRFFLWSFQSFSLRIFWTSLICTNLNTWLSFSPVFHSLFNSHASPTLCTFSFVSYVCECVRYWDMFMHPTLFLPSFAHRHHVIPKVSAIQYLQHHVITILWLSTYLYLHYYSSKTVSKQPVPPPTIFPYLHLLR